VLATALLVLVFCYSCSNNAYAETLTSSNCSTDGTTNFITGTGCASDTHSQSTVNVQSGLTGGTTTGASTEVGNGHNGFVRFKHNPGSWAIQHAITQALAGSGLKIDGYRTTFDYRNNQTNTINGNCLVEKVNGVCIDPLTLSITAKSADGTHVYEQTFDYGQAVTDDWISTQILSWIGTTQSTPGTEISTVDILLQGYDAGFWAGNYGPKVKNMVGDIIVSTDICTNTPLHSTSCPGYSEAYASNEYNNQCNANALYDSGCSGYATAYFNQQCSADPLYDSGCSGYANAHYNQQCSASALYDSGCPGYATAQYNQQCSSDPLYDSGCPGYATAYYNQQCSASALYDSGCPGYASAYYDQQCSASALYDSGCPGYATAYFNQQCTASALYDSTCPGYATAYFNQQCGISALYDSTCPGYATAYLNQQCSLDTLYNSQCPGYATAYFNQQCGISALYDSTCPGYAAAYFSQQCTASGLYDTTCPNYEIAYFDNQCSINALYNPGCPGYTVAVVIDDATPDVDDGTTTAEDIADNTADIISAESITEVSITGDAVIDSIINDTPVVVIIEMEVVEAPVMEVVEEIVPIEIAVETAFDTPVIVESFNSFEVAGPVIAPLASIAQVEQKAELVELEILVESIEAEVEMEMAQLDANVIEIEMEVEVETMSELIEDELAVEEVEVVEEIEEIEVVEEAVKEEEVTDDKEEAEEEPSSDVEQSVDKDGSDEESDGSSDKGTDGEAGDDTEGTTAVAKKVVKPTKMTAEQKAVAKKKKMKEIIKNKLVSLAKDMATATSLKEQAAIQAQISALINFLPGFTTYGGQVQVAGDFYGSDSIYNASKVPENKRGLLNGLASQIKHEAMVDMQYK